MKIEDSKKGPLHIFYSQMENLQCNKTMLKNLQTRLQNLYCYECQRYFSDCESFKTHRHEYNKIKTEEEEDESISIFNNSIKSEDESMAMDEDEQEENQIPLNTLTDSSNNNKNNNNDAVMKENIDLNPNDNDRNKSSPSSTLNQEKMLNNILSSMNINPSDLHDYFRCYKCNSTFYKLFDFIPHFKICQSSFHLKNNNIKGKRYRDEGVQVDSWSRCSTIIPKTKTQVQINKQNISFPFSAVSSSSSSKPSQVEENSPMEIGHDDDDDNNISDNDNNDPLTSTSSPPPEREKEDVSQETMKKSDSDSKSKSTNENENDKEKPSKSIAKSTSSSSTLKLKLPSSSSSTPVLLCCRECNAPPFLTLSHLNAHYRDKHPGYKNSHITGFKCDICEMQFSTSFYLQQHSITHQEVRPILPPVEENDAEESKFKYVTEDGRPTPAYLEAIKNDEKEAGNFKCLACLTVFVTREKLYQHAVSHKKKNIVGNCPWCSTAHPPSQFALDKHIVKMHPDKFSGFHCGRCEKGSPSFPTEELLREHKQEKHVASQTGELICQICGAQPKSSASLKLHLLRHEKDKPFKCTFPNCGKSYPDKYNLRSHEVLHGEKQFKCTEEACQKAYHTNKLLRTHIEDVHSGLTPYECTYPNCNQSFSSKMKRKTHMFVHRDRIFKCTFSGCEAAYKKKELLKSHELTHQGDSIKKFKCTYPDCEYKAIKEYQLHQHVKQVHEKVKNFLCNECGYSCYDNHAYRVHLLTHSDKRPYKCDFCDMAFKLPHGLKTHLRTHKEDRPNKCQFCDKSFKALTYLKRHELTHTKFKPYKCAFCKMAYPDNRPLKKQKSTLTNMNLT